MQIIFSRFNLHAFPLLYRSFGGIIVVQGSCSGKVVKYRKHRNIVALEHAQDQAKYYCVFKPARFHFTTNACTKVRILLI